jgi:hypothetical protein
LYILRFSNKVSQVHNFHLLLTVRHFLYLGYTKNYAWADGGIPPVLTLPLNLNSLLKLSTSTVIPITPLFCQFLPIYIWKLHSKGRETPSKPRPTLFIMKLDRHGQENSVGPSFMRLFSLYASSRCIVIALSPDRHLNPSLCRCATPSNDFEATQEGGNEAHKEHRSEIEIKRQAV